MPAFPSPLQQNISLPRRISDVIRRECHHSAMSLRQKILGAAARWAAPTWTRQGVCGLHTSGAASSSAKAPGACAYALGHHLILFVE